MNTEDTVDAMEIETPIEDPRLPDETSKEYAYYTRYRDMPPAKRSLQALRELCHQDGTSKKISERTLKRYSSKNDWQRRVQRFDTLIEKAAYVQRCKQRKAEIEKFIDNDLDTAIEVQNLCVAKIAELKQEENLDAKELRQIVLTYKECRVWIKNLSGIMRAIAPDGDEAAAERED